MRKVSSPAKSARRSSPALPHIRTPSSAASESVTIIEAARAASMMVTDSDAAEDGVRMCGSAGELLRALFAGEDTFLKFGRLRFAVV